MSDKPATPDDVPVERVERPTGNIFGKTLNKLRGERRMAVEGAKQKMLERHKIDYKNRNKYKIVEDRVVMPNGKEVTELRLYELIDGAVVTINTDVSSELQGGINYLKEFQPYEPNK